MRQCLMCGIMVPRYNLAVEDKLLSKVTKLLSNDSIDDAKREQTPAHVG